MEFDVCDRCYVLGTGEIVWRWPLSRVARRETSPSAADARGLPERAWRGSSQRPPRGVPQRLFRAALAGLGIGDVLRTLRLSSQLRSWIADFGPSLIYSQLSDLPVMALVSEILDESALPFALHIMDDWPNSMYRRGLLAWPVRVHAQRTLESLLNRADARMAIGDAMAAEYLRRYHVPFVPIQNAVEMRKQDSLAALHRSEYPVRRDSQVRVVYTGRIGTANAISLLSVAEVVSEMGTRGNPIRLRVYTSSTEHPAAKRMSRLDFVEIRPAVPHSHVPSVLESADVLLMPLDFDEASVQFAGLSMPTKIPEYMASGRPVLTYAPSGSAVAEYARHGGWSLLVERPEPSLIRDALCTLIDSQALRDAMGERAKALALERHDATMVRARFAAELARSGALGRGRVRLQDSTEVAR